MTDARRISAWIDQQTDVFLLGHLIERIQERMKALEPPPDANEGGPRKDPDRRNGEFQYVSTVHWDECSTALRRWMQPLDEPLGESEILLLGGEWVQHRRVTGNVYECWSWLTHDSRNTRALTVVRGDRDIVVRPSRSAEAPSGFAVKVLGQSVPLAYQGRAGVTLTARGWRWFEEGFGVLALARFRVDGAIELDLYFSVGPKDITAPPNGIDVDLGFSPRSHPYVLEAHARGLISADGAPMPARSRFTRRYVIAKDEATARDIAELRELGFAREGQSYHTVPEYLAHKTLNPVLDGTAYGYGNGLQDARDIYQRRFDDLMEVVADPDMLAPWLRVNAPRMGFYRPAGPERPDDVGGEGIAPHIGYEMCREWCLEARLRADLIAEGSAIEYRNAGDGRPVETSIPGYRLQSRLASGRTIPGFQRIGSHPLYAFSEPPDRQHLRRMNAHDSALVWLINDDVARERLLMAGAEAGYEERHRAHSSSVAASAKPNQGLPEVARGEAWAFTAVATAAALGSDWCRRIAEEELEWLLAQIPEHGITLRQSHPGQGNMSIVYTLYGCPSNHDIAQCGLESPLVAVAGLALALQVGTDEQRHKVAAWILRLSTTLLDTTKFRPKAAWEYPGAEKDGTRGVVNFCDVAVRGGDPLPADQITFYGPGKSVGHINPVSLIACALRVASPGDRNHWMRVAAELGWQAPNHEPQTIVSKFINGPHGFGEEFAAWVQFFERPK